MQLAELQRHFTDGVLYKQETDILPSVKAGAISAAARLAIYRGNVTENLIGALAGNFPVVQTLVGEAFFRRLAQDYMTDHPPHVACLAQYGNHLPAFIDTYEAASSVPYLSDMARFEWAWHSAYVAEDDEALDPSILADLSEEALSELRLAFRCSVVLISSHYPLHNIWDYAQNPEGGTPNISKKSDNDYYLFWRPEKRVLIDQVGQKEYHFLKALSHGHTLGEASENLHEEEISMFLQNAFMRTLFLSHPSR